TPQVVLPGAAHLDHVVAVGIPSLNLPHSPHLSRGTRPTSHRFLAAPGEPFCLLTSRFSCQGHAPKLPGNAVRNGPGGIRAGLRATTYRIPQDAYSLHAEHSDTARDHERTSREHQAG